MIGTNPMAHYSWSRALSGRDKPEVTTETGGIKRNIVRNTNGLSIRVVLLPWTCRRLRYSRTFTDGAGGGVVNKLQTWMSGYARFETRLD